MERTFELFSKLAFIILAAWVVLAGLGYTSMPGSLKQAVKSVPRRRRAKGGVWNVPVAAAPNADDDMAFPAAPVM